MATFAYFISQDYLKKYSVIDGNVDQKLLNPVIRSCQEEYIMPILGTDLYEKLIADIVADTVTGDYKTLLDDWVRPALRQWVVYEAPLAISFKMRNNGLIRQGNEGGTAATTAEVERFEDRYFRKAKDKTSDMYDWLCANSDLFTEYTANTDDGDKSPISVSDSYGGIWLGLRNPKQCCDDEE